MLVCIATMVSILPYIQITLAVLLVAGVLLQTSSAGLGGAFGASDSVDAGYHTRRGSEKFLFNGTIIISILFAAVSFLIFTLS